MIHNIKSDADLDALLAREPGVVEINVEIGFTATLRLPRYVRVLAGWLRASASGATAEAYASGARAVASASGARAVASASGARAEAYASGARAEAYASGATAVAYEEHVKRQKAVTLSDVAKAARWAKKHAAKAGKIDGTVRRYAQATWDCGTTCCVWGAAWLMKYGEPTAVGPGEEWRGLSAKHTDATEQLRSRYATPESIEAACGVAKRTARKAKA